MLRRAPALAAIFLVAPVLPALANTFTEVDRVELTELLDAEVINNGLLGQSLALAGETLLVAAPNKEDPDDSGSLDGSVYSFAIQSDGTLQFEQHIRPVGRATFGKTLAADGDWAAIGESGDKVHLYQRSGSSWNAAQLLQIAPDIPATPGITVRNMFARLVLQGDLLAIGSTNANVTVGESVITNAGAVVLFRRGVNSVWSHEATLASPTPVGPSNFGGALALSGNTLLVGASTDNDGIDNRGRAFVFQRSAGQWAWEKTLIIPNGDPGAEFGWSVALDGDVAIVGCRTCSATPNAGSFFAFERNLGGSDNWGVRGEFAGSQGAGIDLFSSSLRLRGNSLMVGSHGNAAKRVYFFQRMFNGDWQEATILQSEDLDGTRFGISVDFVGGRAFAGAELFPNTSGSERWGAVHAWFSPAVESCGGNLDGIFCDGYEVLD